MTNSSSSPNRPDLTSSASHPTVSTTLENSRRATFRSRRIASVAALTALALGFIFTNPSSYEPTDNPASATAPGDNASASPASPASSSSGPNAADSQGNSYSNIEPTNAASQSPLALDVLEQLAVKGRAPKTGYSRDEFYSDWPKVSGCSLRQIILKREFGDTAVLADDNCAVTKGTFTEPYTGQTLTFAEKSAISKGLQIDHVVALSDAWQKGAQNLSKEERYELATDPLNLLAVDSSANQQKSDGDAATWLPSNKPFRCQYVARQVSVKYKYRLWVTQAEHDAIKNILTACPSEPAIGVEL